MFSFYIQVVVWISLVEENVMTHRSHDGSVFQVMGNSLWGKKQEPLEERRVKEQ